LAAAVFGDVSYPVCGCGSVKSAVPEPVLCAMGPAERFYPGSGLCAPSGAGAIVRRRPLRRIRGLGYIGTRIGDSGHPYRKAHVSRTGDK